jgi:pyroglutamyl-peptidase
MNKTVLITSFSTWKLSQPINSSDQLLAEALPTYTSRTADLADIYVLRQLPVNTPVASAMTIAQIQKLQPDLLICCGMAESRSKLSLESRAVVGDRIYTTTLNLAAIVADLAYTEISDDAGRFVCNSFYHAMLEYLQNNQWAESGPKSGDASGPESCQCIFIHVPIITANNRSQIWMDFCKILDKCMV